MLHINKISKSIDDTVIIKSLSLHVKAGEIVGLLGPNGAGKTTTLKMIMGLLQLDAGTITLNDLTINDDKKAYVKNIGYVPDDPFFYEELTGDEFLQFTTNLWGPDIYEQNKASRIDTVEKLDMTEVMDKPVHTYSLGMKRKLSLLIALIHQPKLLIMDEPFNGLDVMAVHTIKSYLQEFVAQGNAVLISTHMMDVVENFCLEIAIIKQGELLIHENIAKLKESNAMSLEEYFIALVTGD